MSDGNGQDGPDPGEHRTPRWVKVAGMIAAIVVLLLLAVLILGGGEHGPGLHTGSTTGGADHGGDHTSSGDGRQHEGSHTPPSDHAEGRRAPVTWTVEVQDDLFVPDELTIQVGDTVEWVHFGSDAHTVTADDEAFDSHPDCNTLADSVLGDCMTEGDTYNRTLDEVGDVAYHCKLHREQSMVATVHVEETYNQTPEGRHH